MELLKVAISQLGVKEDLLHTNKGEAKKYQDSVGLPHDQGFPWCQSFVFWCGKEAYGDKNPVIKTGGVLDCWRKTTHRRILKSNSRPTNILPGYQFILDLGHGFGHTGLVQKMNADGSFLTIEGNTNSEGSSDGYEVCLRKRHLSDSNLLGFIAYEDNV